MIEDSLVYRGSSKRVSYTDNPCLKKNFIYLNLERQKTSANLSLHFEFCYRGDLCLLVWTVLKACREHREGSSTRTPKPTPSELIFL